MGNLFSTLSKSATTTALDASESALLLFGLILTVGALGEYRMLPKMLLKAPHALFELMVAIGIAGELFSDGGVFLFSRHLQTISDGEFAVLNKEAGDARRDAGNANKEAGFARKDASNANRLAKQYEAQIASANARAKAAEAQVASATAASADAVARVKTADARIAEAQRDAAKATEETARITRENLLLESEALKLRQAAAPRRLTESQKLELIQKLSSVPVFSVQFMGPFSNGVPESFNFTDDLKDVFVRMKRMAPEPPSGRGVLTLAPSLAHGVVILVKSQAEFPPAAAVLWSALIEMTFEAKLERAPLEMRLDANTMVILVGTKQ